MLSDELHCPILDVFVRLDGMSDCVMVQYAQLLENL